MKNGGPFQRAKYDRAQLERTRAELAAKPASFFDELAGRRLTERERREWVDNTLASSIAGELWKNGVYTVLIRHGATVAAEGWPEMIHLSIKRNDRTPIRDWRDMQEIKNELVGTDHEAVELYPAEARLVDTANQYHLWALADPEARFPFGFLGERMVTGEPGITSAVQRPLPLI